MFSKSMFFLLIVIYNYTTVLLQEVPVVYYSTGGDNVEQNKTDKELYCRVRVALKNSNS